MTKNFHGKKFFMPKIFMTKIFSWQKVFMTKFSWQKFSWQNYFHKKVLFTFAQGPYSSRAPFSVIGEMDLHGPEGKIFLCNCLAIASLSNILGKFMIYVSVCLQSFICAGWSICMNDHESLENRLPSVDFYNIHELSWTFMNFAPWTLAIFLWGRFDQSIRSIRLSTRL